MINRIKTISTNNKRHKIFTIFWTILMSAVIIFAASTIFNPMSVSSRYEDDGKTLSFYAVGADNLRQEAGDYLLTLINKDKELIDIVTNDSQMKDELLNASPEQPVRIIGETFNAIDSDEESDAYFEDLKADYFADAKKLYGYQLIEKKIEIGMSHYAGVLFYIILFTGNLFLMISIYKMNNAKFKDVVEFYRQHPEYNNLQSDFDLHQNVAVINNYILCPDVIIDVQTSTDFELEYNSYHFRVHGPYHSLHFQDENGNEKSANMPLLSDTKIKVLEAYLSEYGKTLKNRE